MAYVASSNAGFGAGGHFTPPYYADFLRDLLYPNLYFRQFGTNVNVPAGSGDKVKIPNWKNTLSITNGVATRTAAITAVTAGMAESASPAPTHLSGAYISGSVTQFEGAKGYTSKLITVSKADFIAGALESLGRDLAFVLDRHVRGQISGASSVLHPLSADASGNKSTTITTLKGKVFARAAALLDAAGVPRWDDETYVGIANPLAQFDIFTDLTGTGFLAVAQYGAPERIYRGEVGNLYGVRLVFSGAVPRLYGTAANSATTGLSGKATGANAYFLTPDAFYNLELASGGVTVMHHPPGSAGSADPTNKRGTIGVKVFFGIARPPKAEYRRLIIPHGLSLHY